jgi:hypothetical protein
MNIPKPPWYEPFEQKLLVARPLLLVALGSLTLISGYFFFQVLNRKQVIPAAAWTVYMLMP